ncbi:MAG: NAD(+)/NADH kinase [Leptospirales bacterium]
MTTQITRAPVLSVGIFTKPHRSDEIRSILLELLPWLRDQGISPFLDIDGAKTLSGEKGWDKSDIANRSDLILVMGGDGTLLAAARVLGDQQLASDFVSRTPPILGINLGNLGFLTEVQASETFSVLQQVFSGHYLTEERMMLKTRIIRHGHPVTESHVLNDVVINQGSKARLVEFDIYMDALFVTSLRGDGVIFSTPTGSTAYNLSAGGPIVHPEMDGIIMTPICPHTLTHRPLLVPAHVRLEILIKKGDTVTVTFDGQIDFPLFAGDLLEVTRSPARTTLIVSPNRNYFEVLRDKLKWGDRSQR